MLKPQVALNGLKHNSIDIMCSSIINKYINRSNQYEYLSLIKINILKHHKPKIIRFVNHKNYKDIENW